MEVKESKLRQMFETESGGDAALETFFELVQTGPMSFEYRLRDEVVVIDDIEEPALEGAGVSLMGIANRWERTKRWSKYRRLKRKRPNAPRIVSEGDSWFQHPQIEDVIDYLYAHYNIRSLGAAGDTLANMAGEREFLWEIQSERPHAFLLSGLGNDIMSGFERRLNPYTPDDGSGPRRLLNGDMADPQSYASQLATGVASYRSIAEELDVRFPGLPMLVHGYDYVIPGEGKSGRWLAEPMTRLGYPSGEQRAVMAVVIDDVDRELADLAAALDNVHHIRCLNAAPHPWHDEIHPDDEGYERVAEVFRSAIDAVV